MHNWIELNREENPHNTTTHYRCLNCGCAKRNIVKHPKGTIFNFYKSTQNDFKETKRVPKCFSILKPIIKTISMVNVKTNEVVFTIGN